ncbi:MAG TPA: hypothetical protein VHX39_00590 [Acetobacteraceae bacterium]|nr:hypothetical protein [Acetobacteraceae bacterium]
MYAEQIGHQRRQALLGQQLVMQQTHHDRREARAILHRRGHVFGKGRARLGAASPTNAGMRAVFGNDQRLRLRQVEHLPRGMAGGRRSGQGAAASRTCYGEMIDGGIGVFCPAQRLSGMALLSAGLLAGSFTQAADPH